MNETRTETAHVIAEDAPIGVQLWPTREKGYAPNFTLSSVEVIRDEVRGDFVLWTYESGTTRTFDLGTEVAVRIVK